MVIFVKLKYKLLFIFIFILVNVFFIPTVFGTTEDIKLNSSSAILVDANSGKILYEKNSNDKIYPASLTKVLSAIVILENCNLDDIVTVSKTAIDNIEFGYVTADLKAGEKLTVEQLLSIILISSASDASNVLAEHVAGSVENFAVLMNKKAAEIGCLNSNFTNACGEHNENHYSTAYDLALIGQYAIKNEHFVEISSKTFYELPKTNKYKKTRKFYTTNDLILPSSKNYYKYAIGMKTGFSTPAGQCLISHAKKNDLSLIAVTLNASTSDKRYSDTKKLFEYGFNNFSIFKLASQGDAVQTITVQGATLDTKKLNLILEKDISFLKNINDESSKPATKITINSNLKAPINEGETVGYIEYTLDRNNTLI